MDSIWTQAPEWNWLTFGALCLGVIVLSIVFLVWMMLQPEDPAPPEEDYVRKAVDRDRAAAAEIGLHQDDESGRLGADQHLPR